MAVIDELEKRLEALKQEVADIETAIRVLRTLHGEPVAKLAADKPLFSVRRLAPEAPKARKAGRLTGNAFFDQMEQAEKLRSEIEAIFKRENRPLFSGQVLDLTGVRGRGKPAMDRVYNALQTMYRQGILKREEPGSAWELAFPPVPAAQPAGESERAA